MYNNKQEDKTHQKWELKKQKNSSKEDKKSKKEGRKKIFRDPCHANQFGGKKYLHLQHRHYHLNHLSVSL